MNKAKGVVACSDELFKGDCTRNAGKIFLAWNGLSEKGRVVGTGAYISKFEWKVLVGHEKVGRKEDTFTMGIKHGK